MKNVAFLLILAVVAGIIYTVMVDDAPWQSLSRDAKERSAGVHQMITSAAEVGTAGEQPTEGKLPVEHD